MSDGHQIEVNNSTDEDFEWRLIHPGGHPCESWIECTGHVHLVYEDWELDEQIAHGEEHRIISGYLCVPAPGCWMNDRDLEFNQATYPNGLYDPKFEAEFGEMGVFIAEMIPVGGECTDD